MNSCVFQDIAQIDAQEFVDVFFYERSKKVGCIHVRDRRVILIGYPLIRKHAREKARKSTFLLGVGDEIGLPMQHLRSAAQIGGGSYHSQSRGVRLGALVRQAIQQVEDSVFGARDASEIVSIVL